MTTMAILFAVLSLFVSLGALWFAAEAKKSIDAQTETMIKSYVDETKHHLAEQARATKAVAMAVAELKDQLSTVQQRVENYRTPIDTAQRDLLMVKADLDKVTKRVFANQRQAV